MEKLHDHSAILYSSCYLLLEAGALLLAASSVRAEDVYPPGWNARAMSVGPVLYDFRSGERNDSKALLARNHSGNSRK